jgi:hypothetical protein
MEQADRRRRIVGDVYLLASLHGEMGRHSPDDPPTRRQPRRITPTPAALVQGADTPNTPATLRNHAVW